MDNLNKEGGFKAPLDSMKVLIDTCSILEQADKKISNLINIAESLEKQRDAAIDLLRIAEKDRDDSFLKLCTLQHAFDEVSRGVEILNRRLLEESTMHAEETSYIVQKANDEISRIQKERDDEKMQYLAIQKGFQHQLESNKIKFDNIVKRVMEMRNAQKVYFDKSKKVGVSGSLQELNKARALESDLDNYLRQFQTNLFYTK
ncbi:MAG: hypothetical protein RLZZ628_3136 [Bacteroidota bacterium]|jgi:hypothetical protein